jgi:transglutaminase-like putative cysteine protease
MNDLTLTSMRRVASLCGLLAALPILAQLPLNLAISLILILAISALLPKQPNRLILFLAFLIVLVLMILEYKGRFGRDVAASMLALMMGLKCLETKSLRDLRALLGFSLFLPFAALLSSQTPLTVSLSLLNFAFWLLVLNAISTGKLQMPKRPYSRALKTIGIQILLALPLAVVLFWLFPRISTPLWGLPSLSNQGIGLGDSMKPGQWLDILSDDRIAFRATFKNITPTPEQRYWRGPVLWDFDGLQWTRKKEDSLPSIGQPTSQPTNENSVAYDVNLEATERKYIPSLDWPYSTASEYSISKDGTVYSNNAIQKNTQYSGVSILQPNRNAILDEPTRQRALAFPRGFNKKTQALALQWRAETSSDRAYIARVMQWIRRDFSYTLATDEPGINSTDDFLFTDQKGFCQHFSSSFAILMRAAGIPSRVVTGYVGGYKNPYGAYWVLYQKDAHAWNEVWLDGEGWVRFDPTTAVAPENILDTLENSSGDEQYSGELGLFSPVFDFGDFMKTRWNDWVVGFNAARQEQLFKGIGLAQAQRWQLILILVSLASGISYGLFLYNQYRSKKPITPLERAWQKLLSKMHKLGLGKLPSETALNFAKRMHGKTDCTPELLAICQRYTACRYANMEFSELQTQQLIADILALNRQINLRGKT